MCDGMAAACLLQSMGVTFNHEGPVRRTQKDRIVPIASCFSGAPFARPLTRGKEVSYDQ